MPVVGRADCGYVRMLGNRSFANLHEGFVSPFGDRLRGRQLDTPDSRNRGELGSERSQKLRSPLPDERRVVWVIEPDSEHEVALFRHRDDCLVMILRVEVEREASLGGWVAAEFEKSFVIARKRRRLNPCAEEGIEPGLARSVHVDVTVNEARQHAGAIMASNPYVDVKAGRHVSNVAMAAPPGWT